MLNNLTGLRFYAAFWVFLYHFFPVYTSLPPIDLFEVGYFGVDVFFVLSGFILTYVYYDKFFLNKVSWKDYYHFVVKRFAKIYPLHFLITLIFIPVVYIAKYLFHQETLKVYPEALLQNFLMIHSWNTTEQLSWNFPSWSISAEWFAYLFLFVPLALLYRKGRFLFVVLGLMVISLFVYRWFRIPNFTMDFYTVNGLPRIIPEFILGMLIGLVKLKYHFSRLTSSLLFFGSLLFLGVSYSTAYFQELSVFPFAGLILSLSYKTYFDFVFSSKQLVYLGNISFAFYLTVFSFDFMRAIVQNTFV